MRRRLAAGLLPNTSQVKAPLALLHDVLGSTIHSPSAGS